MVHLMPFRHERILSLSSLQEVEEEGDLGGMIVPGLEVKGAASPPREVLRTLPEPEPYPVEEDEEVYFFFFFLTCCLL